MPECYDYLFNATNEIFDEMIAKKNFLMKMLKNSFQALSQLLTNGMYLQSITLENYNLKENLIDYIKMLDELLQK